MIFHLHACFYIQDEPQDQPVTARRRSMDEAEPEEVSIPKYKAQNIGKYSQHEPRQKRAQPVGIDFHRFLQMGVGRERFPLNTKLDR